MIERTRRFAADHPEWVMAGVWLAFVSWRPLVLGFYGDDWISIVEELGVKKWGFAQLQEVYRSRPGWAAFAAILGPLAGAGETIWHVFGVAIVGFTMVAVYWFAAAVLSQLPVERNAVRIGATVAACCWVLFPWGIAVTVWPEAYAVALAVGLVCLSGTCLLRGDLSPYLRWPGAVCGFAAACLVYEAFWGFYIPVLMIFFAAGNRRRALRDAVPMTVVQLALVAFNRGIVDQDSTAKSLAGDWPAIFIKSFLVHLPFEMANAAGLATVLIAAGGLILLAAAWGAARQSAAPMQVSVVAAAAVCGILGTCLIFALGGYRLAGNDQSGTTFAAVNIWLALLIGIGAGLSSPLGGRADAGGRRWMGLVLVLAGLAIINPLRVSDWARGWTFQKAVLDAVPVADLMAAGKGGSLLADLPRPPRTVAGFHGSWMLRRAIAVKYPELFENVRHIAVANSHIWFSRWDGRELLRGSCQEPDRPFYRYDMPPPLILWRYGESSKVIDAPSFAMGCDRVPPAWHRLFGILYPFAGNPFEL